MPDHILTLEDAEITATRSEVDGALLVFIDTNEGTGHVRIQLNEAILFDDDPETAP